MKHFPLAIAAALCASPVAMLPAQNSSTDQIESTGRSILADPRLQNMLRSVKNDPEAAVKDIKSAPEDSVRDATQMFLQAKEKVESSGIDTPENRAKARELTNTAVSTVTGMAESNPEAAAEVRSAIENAAGSEIPAMVASPVATPVEAAPADVPATRPANSATHFVTPITMPADSTPTALAADAMPSPVVQTEFIEPIASAAPTEQRIPNSPALTSGSVPAPQPLSPKYDTKSGGQSSSTGSGESQMVITSQNSVMDNNSGLLTFTGNVLVDYDGSTIKCDRLEVYLNQEKSGSPMDSGGSLKKAIASGGMVEINRIGENNEKQSALARRAEFDNLSKDIVLSGGPPQIQSGGSSVITRSEDSRIIMRGNGKYEVTGSDAGTKGRSRIVIPVPDSGQNKDAGIGGGLGGILERGR